MAIYTKEPVNADRAVWVGQRRGGVGGSDIAAVCGVSRYRSPFHVYADKTDAYCEPENNAMKMGTILEPVVAKMFADETGKRVRVSKYIYHSKAEPYFLANIDRLVVGEKAILECKTASAFAAEEWEGGSVPIEYYAQVQWYMGILGYERAYLACLVGGRDFYVKEICRDDEYISWEQEKARDFWHNHVLAKKRPALSHMDDADVNSCFCFANDESITLDDSWAAKLAMRDMLVAQKKTIADQIGDIDVQIKEQMGGCYLAECGEYKVIWNTALTKRIDTKLLKEQYPDVYKEVCREYSSRRFIVKRNK